MVQNAKSGEEEATKALIEQYKPFIIKECSKYRIPGYTFEDLVQHSYLTIIKAIHQYKFGKNTFTTYVTTSISNNLKYLLRGAIKHHREVPEEAADFANLPNYEFTIEDQLIAYEEVKKLYEALDKLKPEEREIIDDFYIRKIPLGEIAEDKGATYGAISKRKDRALKKLRRMLEE